MMMPRNRKGPGMNSNGLLRRVGLCAAVTGTVLWATAVRAVEADDKLNATLWMQTSVEYAGVTMGAYRLAAIMLDRALADPGSTAIPDEQGADYSDKPPAVILDLDETILDNSRYQAWTIVAGTAFSRKTWNAFVNAVESTPVPGSLEFAKYAEARGVKVFYVSNRTAGQEEATRRNLEKYGYPMGGNVDTVLLWGERPGWMTSGKGPRRRHVARDYRVLLLLGDNLGDFVDGHRGSLEERRALMEANGDMWGTKWIVLPNPSYGSWEVAAVARGHGAQDRHGRKRAALSPWQP